MSLTPRAVLIAFVLSMLANGVLILVLARTTPDATVPPHTMVAGIPFVPEPPPPPAPEREAMEAPSALAPPIAAAPSPPTPNLTASLVQVPAQPALQPAGLSLAALGAAPTGGGGRGQAKEQDSGPKEASLVDEPPRALSRPFPRYPAEAEDRGLEGTVTIRLRIDTSGRVAEAKVVDSSLPEVFDAAALQAIRGWRFTPPRDGGRAVEVWARQTLRFDLQ